MSLLHRYVRTRGFSLGIPGQVTVGPDGTRVVFVRARSGDDPAGCLWVDDGAGTGERLLVDPDTLPARDTEVSDHERARAERMRIVTMGVTGYATDAAVRRAVFAVSGRVWLVDIATGAVTPLPSAAAAIDPRLSPDGTVVAYVADGALRVIGADGHGDRALATPEHPDVTYGLAEHVASESMGRYRGFWFSPDSTRLLVSRVDNSPLQTWYLSDPTDPTTAPVPVRYPAAGTANADVSLSIMDLEGRAHDVVWDRAAFEYVTAVSWDAAGLVVVVQNRAQSVLRALDVDPGTGATTVLRENHDPMWTTIVPGVPAHTASGALVWVDDHDGSRTLFVGADAVTPAGLHVREVLGVDGDTVLFTASDEPASIPLWTYDVHSGLTRITGADGVHEGWCGGATTVVHARTLDDPSATVSIHRAGEAPRPLRSLAERPATTPRVRLLRAGQRQLRTALLYPSWHTPGSGRLPVLMDPYGGPAAQRVLAAGSAYVLSQWFADQGFAVVIVDGRGTPGRGPAWERTVHGDRATVVLDDQVAGCEAVAAEHPDLDLTRVGIRGWSFGGFLAALAVLRRPDFFHAAVAGAPVTDQRLYDTHWQERYLGHPEPNGAAYDASSLLADAPGLRRPLMLVHGLRDDNVHAAHTLRLSAALLAAGRPHTVLPLGRASHMVRSPDDAVALRTLEAAFLLDALNPVRDTSPDPRTG